MKWFKQSQFASFINLKFTDNFVHERNSLCKFGNIFSHYLYTEFFSPLLIFTFIPFFQSCVLFDWLKYPRKVLNRTQTLFYKALRAKDLNINCLCKELPIDAWFFRLKLTLCFILSLNLRFLVSLSLPYFFPRTK